MTLRKNISLTSGFKFTIIFHELSVFLFAYFHSDLILCLIKGIVICTEIKTHWENVTDF